MIENGQVSGSKRLLLITKNDFRAEMDGGAKRTASMIRALEASGFQVDAVAVKPGLVVRGIGSSRPRTAALIAACLGVLAECLERRSVSTLKWFSLRAVRCIVALRADSSRSYVGSIIEFSQLVPYLKILPRPLALDMHNLESELLKNYSRSSPNGLRRMAARYEAARMKEIEAKAPSQFSLIGNVSSRDRDLLRSLSNLVPAGRSVVAPNGVDDDCFEFAGPRSRTVVFVAHLGWQPNVDAAAWLAQEVWPHVRILDPSLTLQLIGRSPDPRVRSLAANDIELHADVESPIPYVGTASVATAPLLAAGGTRLKILEALACGTPVVSTQLGALGLESLVGPNLRVADDPESFANQIVSSAELRPDRGSCRQMVEPFRWSAALDPFVSGIRDLVQA